METLQISGSLTKETRPGWQGGLNNLAESWGFEPQIPLGGILA